jgi:hypothetical protein
MDIQNNFIKGRMNKSLDERLIPPGEYVDALNIEVSSIEGTNIGSVKNIKGNTQKTTIKYNGSPISSSAVCLGAVENGATATIYWFVHSPVDGVDMIVSYNENIDALTYHVVSTSVLNFDALNLITGVNLIDDLLLWTDNRNQPRKINVNRSYPQPIAGVDQITEADIALIVAPPTEAPTVVMKNISGFENYMDIRFVCFGYRYKYEDGEYSALSQFSDAAFVPGGFQFDEDTYSNNGMLNVLNGADVSFNTGSDRVVGIDLCFKLNDSNIINVIEKFNKEEQGWPDNSVQTIEFGPKKIYTTLPESELLRVYDNVPRLAKAQTIMGNRVMFGNYIDGYNIELSDTEPIEIDFTLSPESEGVLPPDVMQSSGSNDNASYTAPPSPPSGPYDNVVTMDFSNVGAIEEGDVIQIELVMNGAEISSVSGIPPAANQGEFSVSIGIVVDANYANINAFSSSAAFQAAVGNALNIQPIANACIGGTLSDRFACAANVPALSGSSYIKGGYGYSALGQGFGDYPYLSTTANTIDLAIPAMYFTGSATFWQYYSVDVAKCEFSYIKAHYNRSLHSNRSYELGIVYMDEFGRNTTALVCDTNSAFFAPSTSVDRNFIKVFINSLPPYWATRYKFVAKPSKGAYNIIYSDESYSSAALGTWFRLEGQNQLVAGIGTKLFVKKDALGPTTSEVVVEILDVQFQSTDFILGAPSGLYMKVNDGLFSRGVAGDVIVFETEPDEVNDAIYYESSQNFAIVGGYHQGNLLNQGAVQPAVSDLDFFNCYTFGNGVEGYKIDDGVAARGVVLGNRFSSVANEDYSEAHRFASITYSGVYQGETNINKLNEFNLALANYDDLEKSFASIQKMYGRQTDVLVLQEDKISYVLAGKNLLSDSSGGGAITSVPEVLGTQIARLEEYGISLNPESFAAFGYDKFFTDAKRGAVLRLYGSAYSNEQLIVVSESGMGSWFRDEFNASMDSQKIGGYDPYLDEYVLSIKPDSPVEMPEVIVPCGTFIDTDSEDDSVEEFTLALGKDTGSFNMAWTIGPIGGTIEFQVIYNGVTTSSGPVSSSGSMAVSKPTAFPTTATVRIITVGIGGQYTLEIGCL